MMDHDKDLDLDLSQKQEQEQEFVQDTTEENPHKELYVRLNADFQNFKRRVDKERIEWMQAAQINTLEKLLSIFDELDRAIELSEKQESIEIKTWLEGFKLIQKNWQKTLSTMGVKEVPTEGQFNPILHEALMHEASTEKQSGEIVKVFSKGYQLRDKVIQHAKVSVAQ